MGIAERTIQLLNPDQICVDESDQPVYKLSKKLQWRFSDRFGPGKYRKINPSSLWFTNRRKWFRQNYGIVWIIHCWNGLFGVSKPHQKGIVLYSG